MSQEHIWEREYRQPGLLTRENKPQGDIVRFVKSYRKNLKKDPKTIGKVAKTFADLKVLDVGSGTGRNSFYFAELGASVIGLEISDTALQMATHYLNEQGMGGGGVASGRLSLYYIKHDIGTLLPPVLKNESFDLALDITSSNSLDEAGREVCVREIHRVLKSDGILLLKTLCKDGDENAKTLLKTSPGPQKDTYVLPGLGLVERVWTRQDLTEFYGKYFTITSLEKKTSYMLMNGRSYKRNFWIAKMTKK